MTDQLHVVFGLGQVGRSLTGQLVSRGLNVRAVSRRRPAVLDEAVDWRCAVATDAQAASDAGRVEIAIGRASDFFGPGVTESTMSEEASRWTARRAGSSLWAQCWPLSSLLVTASR